MATISLRLIRDASGENLVPVVEIMRNTTTIQACISEGRLGDIVQHIENGRSEYGMQSLDQHLVELVESETISVEAAKSVSRSTDLERKLMFT